MNMDKISIVVPIYKVPEDYLRKCIISITNQTYANIEVLLVDDGSPDKCGEICDEYACEDARICVIHKENGGLSAARNSGYESATGDWLMFVDGDDWIEPDTCQVMVNIATRENVQLVMCAMQKEYEHTSKPYKYYLEDKKVYRGDECKWLQEQLLHFNGNISVAYCKLISKKLLDDGNIKHNPELRQGAEGLEFNLRLFEHLRSAVFINKAFYHYIYNENSISASHNEANHDLVVRCFEKIKYFIDRSENKEALIPWFYNRLLYVVITTAISGYFNPSNTEPYSKKKRKYCQYIEKPLIKVALEKGNYNDLSMQRKVILFLIKKRMFFIINLLGFVRKLQKSVK